MAQHYAMNPAYRTVENRGPWSPGVVTRLPWLGFAALVGSVVGVAASIAVLIASDGRPIADWRIQPTVWLSVASTASNIMLHYALTEGVNVSWWRRAMIPHTQLGDLHRNWAFGNSLWSAATAGRYVNVIAIASILTAIAPINNPLLQRASRVTDGNIEVFEPKTLKLSLASEIPRGYTGYISGRGYDASLFTANYSGAVAGYYDNTVIQLTEDAGCQGTCKARATGVGLAVNCSSYTWPFDLNPSTEQPYNVSNDPAVINGTNVFQTLFEWVTFSGNMSLNVQYKSQAPCAGNLIIKNCTMQTALVQYPVVVTSNNTITLDPNSTIFDDVLLHKINIATDPTIFGPTTLGGYYLALKNKFNSEAHLRWVGADGYELLTSGSTATQYAVTNITTTADGFDIGSSCSLTFTDPTIDLINSARNLMFRTALSAAVGNSSDAQAVSALQTSTPAVYQSEYKYLAIAVALTAIAVVAVTLTFHGYHALGRDVTMSPLETAKAFNAPLLQGVDSNADVKELMRSVGERSVRYGAVRVGGQNAGAGFGGGTYMVGKEGAQSGIGTQYVPGVEEGEGEGTRLEMADERVVQAPTKGCNFSG